ncbi:ribonuclease H-like domain-containing protein [Tanacetum coccineum]
MAGDDNPKKGVSSSSSDLNLTFGDPLYLHPNDTSGSPIVTIKLTDNTNPALANQWDMCNFVVFTWILNSLSSDLYVGAIHAKSASEIWNDLKDTYDKVDGSDVFNLHKSINSLNQNGASLADYYNNLNSSWKQFDAMVSLPALKAAFAIVSGEKSHKNIISVGATKPTATAFVAKAFDKKDRCFEIVGYPAGYIKRNFNPNSRPVISNNTTVDSHSNNASSNTASNSSVSLSNEQLTRLMNLLNDNGVSTASANITQALITKIGDLKINNNITLYDVLVPEYAVSLLSVHKLSRDGKLFVGFNESNCYIHDLKENRIVRIGRLLNGLYLFNVDNACKIVSNNSISTCFVSKTLWHQRLGHLADQVLDALKTSLNLDSHSTSDHLCDTGNKAKQTREPFSLSGHKSNKIGELVHLDVWGPYKITSRDGFRIPSSVLSGKSPYFYVYGHDPSLSNFRGNDDSEATSMDEINNTHHEDTVPNETDFINYFYENLEFNSNVEKLLVNTLRRSSRQTKLPTSLNDFIVEDGKSEIWC